MDAALVGPSHAHGTGRSRIENRCAVSLRFFLKSPSFSELYELNTNTGEERNHNQDQNGSNSGAGTGQFAVRKGTIVASPLTSIWQEPSSWICIGRHQVLEHWAEKDVETVLLKQVASYIGPDGLRIMLRDMAASAPQAIARVHFNGLIMATTSRNNIIVGSF